MNPFEFFIVCSPDFYGVLRPAGGHAPRIFISLSKYIQAAAVFFVASSIPIFSTVQPELTTQFFLSIGSNYFNPASICIYSTNFVIVSKRYFIILCGYKRYSVLNACPQHFEVKISP